MSSHPNDPWKKHSRHWSSVGQPLRPGAEDIAFTCGAISEWFHSNNGTAPTLLVMGVTPELCSLPTNSGSRFIAVDQSAEMIGNLWHPRPGAQDQAVCADWRQMSLAPSTVDIALGDGSLSTLQYPSEYITVFGELRRVLRPGSRCVIRCFMQTDTPETTDEVFADLSQTRIGSFHVLKWRLMMALQPDAEQGVAVQGVWNLLNQASPDLNLLAERFSWPIEQVRTVVAYRGVKTRYTFPTRTQYCEFFTAAGFSVVQVATQNYELGERCPTFVLERVGCEREGR
jgi:hypothetical protein